MTSVISFSGQDKVVLWLYSMDFRKTADYWVAFMHIHVHMIQRGQKKVDHFLNDWISWTAGAMKLKFIQFSSQWYLWPCKQRYVEMVGEMEDSDNSSQAVTILGCRVALIWFDKVTRLLLQKFDSFFYHIGLSTSLHKGEVEIIFPWF